MKSAILALLSLVSWTDRSCAVDFAEVEDLAGAYRGFSYTVDVASGVGEIELTIDRSDVVTRLATGTGVKEVRRPLADLIPMPANEHAPEFRGDDEYRYRAFRTPEGYPHFYFLFDPDAGFGSPDANEFGLFILNEDSTEAVGPTALFSTRQSTATECEQMLDALGAELGGGLARLPESL